MYFGNTFIEKAEIFISSFFSFWQGGIDVVWSAVGFFAVFLLICSIKNQKPLAWMDAFALPTILFFIIFSVASFFAGWRYGSPVSENVWFSVTYNLKDVLYSGPIHAVQLYSAFVFTLLFIIGGLLWTRKIRHSWPNGIYGGMMISASLFTLSFLEIFRGDVGKKVLDIFPISSILFFVVAIALLIFMIWKGHFSVFSKFKSIIGR